ncbi:BTB/POZ domain-containing protein At3g22104 isoform X1 [Oryza brachyantha]|uniref:BTB/POZ domain-containing protein At3g22104 isoform X1 n=1 Tax=Oryza brachyantha TaxID=4533 RepID=UPI001ADA1172|nr:BTB/POZ domain-containing protein At3g22104 isoform X1 [Oryza brachyantha]
MACVLEVDVDGEELFLVDKDVLAPFCGRIKNLAAAGGGGEGVVGAAAPARGSRRVVLRGFPGGAEAFELVARFCYTGGGGVAVTSSNACALRCAAEFMDMAAAAEVSTPPSLVKMTEKALDEMPQWSWQSVVDAVKQCQRLLPVAESTGVFDRVVGALVSHMAVLPGDATPTSSSPESSAFRFSCDTKSSCLSTRCTSRTWWFEDLVVVLGPGMLERVARALVAKGTDHGVVSRFLFYYLKCRLAGATADDKRAMLEAAVAVMAGLDRSSVSCKGLFGILRISSPLKLAASCHDSLVAMIGGKLDHATLDNLLVPSPAGTTSSLYDVTLVLRFLDAFLHAAGAGAGAARDEPTRLKKVGKLIDLYLAEVAPDPSLRPAKFVELATALPAAARDCHDALYRAIDVYFQVHTRLTDEEKMRICKGINYEKLSPECCKHLARNASFPTRAAVQALASQHTVLKSLLRGGGPDQQQLKPVSVSSSPPPARLKHRGGEEHDDLVGGGGGVVLYARRLDLSLESQNLRSLLDGMHWRVMELEKVCSRMKTQMSKMKAARRGAAGGGAGRASSRSLPRMCS